MSFSTLERRSSRASSLERALSPPRADTGSLLQEAIEKRLHETIEVPETSKSEGSYWQQGEADNDNVVSLDSKHLEMPEGPAIARPLTPNSPSLAPASVDGGKVKRKYFRVGDVWQMEDGRLVKVLFIGQPNPPFLSRARNIEDKKWVGLEVVSEHAGKNDGKGPRGHRYFKCAAKKGLFMRQKDFKKKQGVMVRHEQTEMLEGEPQAISVEPRHEQLPSVTLNRQRSNSNPVPPTQTRVRGRARRTTGFNPWKQTRYDTKGFTSVALSQKNMRAGVGFGHVPGRDARAASRGAEGRKTGPRQVGRSRQKLASEMAGIKPWSASSTPQEEVTFKPMRYDTKGLGRASKGGMRSGGKKLGPNAIRHQGGRTKLASEAAGIKPWSASNTPAEEVKFGVMRYDTKGLSTMASSQKDARGHYKQSTRGGAGFGGHKLGPKAIRHQGGRVKLASEMAGIKPMTAQQSKAVAAESLFKPMRYDTKGLTTMATSQKDIHGHYKESTSGAGFGGHKLGPKAIRHQGGRTKLASEAAGIKPWSASETPIEEVSFRPMRYDTKGLTTMAVSQKDIRGHAKASTGGSAYSGQKLGPKAIRHQGDHHKLASEMAGIKPWSASNAPAEEVSFGVMRYDTKGLTMLHVSQKDLHGHHKRRSVGGGGFSGHKLGPKAIRHQGDHAKLASEAAGIKPWSASNTPMEEVSFGVMRYDTKGLTTLHVSQKDLHGHHKASTGGAGFGGHKLGPRAIRHQGDHHKLASEMAGIKPMTAQQSAAAASESLFKPMRYDTKGLTTLHVSQKDLNGHVKQSTPAIGFVAYGAHKLGPRQIRHQGDHTKLASEAAGIKPMTAQESAAGASESLFKPMRYDTKGFTAMALSNKHTTPMTGGHKQGPREIGRNHQQLASEAAGIRRAHASEATANRSDDLFKTARYDTKGFSTTYN